MVARSNKRWSKRHSRHLRDLRRRRRLRHGVAIVGLLAASAIVLVKFVAPSGADPGPPYYGPAVLATSGLAGYWPMDETSGTIASDQVTPTANGTYQGGVTLGGTGAITTSTDYAPTFNGTSGYMSTASASKLQPAASASLEVWFKTSATGTSPIMQAGVSTGLRLFLNSGRLEGAVDGVTVQSSSSYNDGHWHYAVLTWDGTKMTLYADGALAPPYTSTANPQAETSAPSYGSTGVYVGKNATQSSYFNGSIDEPALYGSNSNSSGALTAGQVANHYAAATSGLTATPVNVVVPTVTGKPIVGSVDSVADSGSWNSSTEVYGALTFTYQWLRCDYTGANCSAISGATGSSYTVTSDDTEHALAAKVTATNTHGSASVTVHLPMVGGYRAAVFTDGGSNLRGYWPLDETYSYPFGQAAADISSSPANGTYQSSTGETLNQAGAINDGSDRAVSFDGLTGYVSTGSVSKLQPTASLTLEAWFKTTATSSQWLMTSGPSTTGAVLTVNSIGRVFGAVRGVSAESDKSYNDGKWHYAVMTWDGSKVAIYVDGSLAPPPTGLTNPSTETTAPSYGSTGVYIGRKDTGAYFNGSIDEAAMYGSSSDASGALSAMQVANHYRLGLFQPVPPSYDDGGSNAADPGSCNCDQSTADPVNTENGDYSETLTDVALKSYGPSVAFSRTYDASLGQAQAAAGTPGPLGYGWTDNWGAALSVTNGVVTITQGNSAQVSFYPPVAGTCQAPYIGPGTSGTYCALPSVTATLTYNSGSSTYTFITHPYESYTFNSSGKLTGETGVGGASTSITYNSPSPGSGHCPSGATSCTTITSASGRALVIAANSAGEVTSVTDPLARAWTYAYCSPPSSTCSANDLISVTDPMSRVTSYSYDQGNSNPTLKHDLLTITKPNGQTGGPDAGDKLVNTYDSSGRVTSQTDPNGNETTFDYTNFDSADGLGDVVTTDPDGNETKYSYYGGVLVSEVKGYTSLAPSTTGLQPDPATLLDTTVVDPNGNPSEYSYTGAGDVTSHTNQLRQTSTYSQNSFDEVTCAATAMAASACSSLSPPAPVTPGGSITPPSSAPPAYVTYSAYDTNGNLVWTNQGDYAPGSSSPAQLRTTYNLYNGESVTIGGNTDSCTTSAPSAKLPCATIDPNGVITQLGYDSAGDVTSSSTPDGNTGGEVAQTTYGFDNDGEQISVTAPDGNVSGGNAANYTTTTAYDNDGEVTSVTVGHTGGSYTARTTSYGYDENGNKTSTTDPRGKTTNYAFNADDQLTLVTDQDNQVTLTCYDGDGNVTETVPPVGVAANSLTPSSCPTSYPSGYGDRLAGDSTTYRYNALAKTTTMTRPAPAGQTGLETTTYTYDGAGQLTTVTAPPTSNAGGAANQVTAYIYDDAGRVLVATVGSGTSAASTTSYCYDPDGEKTAVVAPDGNVSGIVSCSTTSPYQTSSVFQTGYSYDSLGELVARVRPATTWAAGGQTTSYTFDPAGNPLIATDPNGTTTTDTYTPLNQVASISYSGSSAHAVSYGYDANGNRLSMVDGSGTSTYTYDPFGELTTYQNGAGKTVSYTYNGDGKTTSITYPLGSGATWATTDSVDYAYDNADELNTVTDFTGHTITVGSTADGLPNSETLGSTGDSITTTYDPTDQPSQITLANGSSTLLQLAYSDVPSGAISSETDTPSWSGSPAAYTYDSQRRVTQMTPGSGSALNYSFDASGNLITLPAAATGSYDNASELTSTTTSGSSVAYVYDTDGERTQATQAGTVIVSASYNGALELKSYSDGAADMTAATYDGDGLRQTSTITPAGRSAVTESFTWDVGVEPHLLLDADSAYIYAAGGTPTEQVNLGSGAITYLVADSLGSVRGIVDGSSGVLSASTAYDAWGNVETSGGLAMYTPFGYAGGYVDPTGLSYLIHRYYDATTGQFLTVDPVADNTNAPYSYASGDPTGRTDSTGLCSTSTTNLPGLPGTQPYPSLWATIYQTTTDRDISGTVSGEASHGSQLAGWFTVFHDGVPLELPREGEFTFADYGGSEPFDFGCSEGPWSVDAAGQDRSTGDWVTAADAFEVDSCGEEPQTVPVPSTIPIPTPNPTPPPIAIPVRVPLTI